MYNPTPIIFDSDGGVDDATALWFACMSPLVEVVAVTAVEGNVTAEQAAKNLATVLAAAGHQHVPVAIGPPHPVGRPLSPDRPVGIHGYDGLGDVGIVRVDAEFEAEPAQDLLRRLTLERPGELTLVTVGPLTNVALALKEDPAMATRVRRLVSMAGSARAGGNASAVAEANIANDPEGAEIVVNADWATPPLLVGLDVTLRATLTDVEFGMAAAHRTGAAAFLDGPLRFYRSLGSTFSAAGTCPCHDLLAVMAVVYPELVTGPVLPIAIDVGESAGRGATVVDFRYPIFIERNANREVFPARWQIGMDVDVDAFRLGVRNLFSEA